MKKSITILIIILISQYMYGQNFDIDGLDQKIEILIDQLTLEEKASLCSGRDDWSTQPIERLNIPWIWMADGPHGLRRAPATNKPGYGDQHPATCYPTASALAATWDLDLIHEVGVHMAKEAQALGVNMILGPGVNIKRSVLGGRNFEYFSEDPILAGEMGAAFINGVQSQGVGTSLKHFTANNVETMRMYMNSDVDTRTLNEIYLRPFEIAVKKSQPWTIMACYNRVQGKYGTQNPYLLTKILKEEWGFEGVVISDWFAIVDRVEAIKAGMHIEMPHVSDINDKLIVKAVKEGALDEKLVDDLLRDILKMVFKAKSLEKPGATFDQKEHHGFARQVAAEAATLLKNERDALPITKDKYKKIAVIGEFATNPRYQGNGSSEVKPTMLDNALDVINKEYGEYYDITYSKGYDLEKENIYEHVMEATENANDADIVLYFAGLPLSYESEGIDRKHIKMPEYQEVLLAGLNMVSKKLVVILNNGSAIEMPWINKPDAVLEGWLGGQAGAGGIIDVLFGKVNPSGKLAETFPKKLEDTPAYFNFPGENGTVLYGERFFVGYRYYDEKKIEPLFPFGFGLSYTDFEIYDMKVSKREFTDEEMIEVSCRVKNVGPVFGKEVVQVYVKDDECSLQRPEKELKAFAKIALKPGEEKVLKFALNARDFSFYHPRYDQWIAESGNFTIWVGSSSRHLTWNEQVSLKATKELPLNFDEYTFFSEYWKHKECREILKEMVPGWIGQFVGEGKSLDEAQFHGFLVDHPLIKYPYITSGEMTHEQVNEIIERCKGMTFIP